MNNQGRKEREEVDQLKKELQRLQEDSRIKDQKNKMTIERLKHQVDELTVRNKEL